MPHHVRHQVRDRAALIIAGLPTTGSRVYKSRTRALGAQHEPTWLIYTRRETSETDTQGNVALARVLSLFLEGRVTATGATAAEDAEDLIDLMAAEVEPAMVSDPSFGGLAQEVTLTATDCEVVAPGDTHEGRIVLQYRVVYRTRESDPTVAI
jgi:hypothetical protein